MKLIFSLTTFTSYRFENSFWKERRSLPLQLPMIYVLNMSKMILRLCCTPLEAQVCLKIERLVLVPSLLRSLLMYLSLQERSFLNHLKLWVCSGETLATSLAEEFFAYFTKGDHKLCNFYGSTEVMGDVTYHVMSNLDQVKQYDKVPIGLPVDNTIIYLLDSDFRPVKTGEIGELFVSGQNLASGYVNGRDPEKFIENPLAVDPTFGKLYRTGDFARIQKGILFYEGRTDSQVKIRGHRVDLSEVEKAVNAIEEVDKGIVICYKPGELNQALLAFVTTEANINENHIESILRDQLAPYMVPRVVIIETVPLLVNGKIDRQSLLRNFENSDSINGSVNFQVDIDFTGVADNQMEAARILFETVAVVLNRSARSAISIEANFYDIGGNSLNSIFTIMSLNEKGYHISIGDFIASMDLGEVLDRMTGCSQSYAGVTTQPPCYSFEYLKDEHKKEVIQMITTSFFQKADLEQWLMPDISERDYDELIGKIWAPLVEKELSFVTKTNSGKIVGVALNFDARDEPEVEIHSKLTIIFEFLEFLEGPIRDSILPKGVGTILHSFMMATNSELTTKENVGVMQFMEEQVIRIAKTKGFVGVFTSNTSPLTQQLGRDIYQYKTLLDYQVNQYITSDGMKPFGMAPDSQRVIVQWKEV
ncbi:uncharacterized protein LOC108741169 isoform X2 [Agrilus planipennis]|uniref:Uncharacterized protein LOC108741169 isoform X2 n=1 Tax=Agrilus planipennis TaxID=224129 RepID=A0A7F5RBZ5_AGRPL|nr:uncharacterized protein LOC108741169 isoform X2 [Agrilus planipennis]